MFGCAGMLGERNGLAELSEVRSFDVEDQIVAILMMEERKRVS